MIPSEITIGHRARLCVTTDGHGYFYGTVEDFAGDDVLMQMDSGSTILVPWYEIIGTDEPRRSLDPAQKLEALLMEWLLSQRPRDA